nr:MAG TPA: hypothetical protein [Caudoviricetes sp.]
MINVVTYATTLCHREHLLMTYGTISHKCMAIFRYSYSY